MGSQRVRHNWATFTSLHTSCCSVSRVQLFATLWTIAHQAPLSMGFPRQEYWNGLPFPPYFRGSSPPSYWTHVSCIFRQILYHWATRKVHKTAPKVWQLIWPIKFKVSICSLTSRYKLEFPLLVFCNFLGGLIELREALVFIGSL